MSDLISRKALYNELARIEELARNRVIDTPTSSPSYSRYSAQLSERTSLKHIVADMPTAYDVDKVVGQLENIKNERWPDNSIMSGKHKLDDYARNVIDLAISIVKGAVKDE